MSHWNVRFKEPATGKKWSIYFCSQSKEYAEIKQLISQKFGQYQIHSFIRVTNKKWEHFSQILPTVNFSEFHSHRSCFIKEILNLT